MNRIVRLLDLVADANLIRAYCKHHEAGAVWPEVTAHLVHQGFLQMEIWQAGDRLVMIAEVAADFPRPVESSPENVEWERTMDKFQRALSFAPPGVKWVDAACIFDLREQGVAG